jgi:hypothetical protein
VTCDNASNNDAMIEALSNIIPAFAGPASQTRCFLHIVNLIAKSLLRQFDAMKTDLNGTDPDGEVEDKDQNGHSETEEGCMEDVDESLREEDEADNDEGWVDESKELTAGELEELKRTTRPVKVALLKVRMSCDS